MIVLGWWWSLGVSMGAGRQAVGRREKESRGREGKKH